MKKYIRLTNLFLMLLFFFTACKKDNVDPDGTNPTKEDTIPKYVQTANVYVAGSTYDSVTNNREAAYWKNEVPVILTHGNKYASVNAIAVDGNNVYAAGFTTDANGAYIATYWKNGVQVNLTKNNTSASAGSIAIQGNDVYIAGFVGSSAVFWKNGEQFNLPLLGGMTIGSSAGIAVQGSDVYVSGYQVGGKAAAVYWKNGEPRRLPNDSVCYAGKNIVFQDGIMYTPATYQGNSKSARVNYWKNEVPISLTDLNFSVNAIQILVKGTDLYLACITSKGSGYLKNNQLTLLSVNASSPEITGIDVIDKDVYCSGQSTYQKKSVATFWKNNIPVYLSSPIGKGGFASAIVVKPL